jgi:hypothetical protein
MVATLVTGLHLIFRRRQQVLEFELQQAHEQEQQGKKETEL